MLTYSRLSSYCIASFRWITRRSVLLLLIGGFSVQAQEPSHAKKEPKFINITAEWLRGTELPAHTPEPESANKKPGFVSTAAKWLRRTDLPGDLQIHGFVGQSYILTSDNNVFGNSDNGGSFGFTEAGLNVSVRPLPRLQLSSQMLSRRAGEGTSATPRLDYAVLDYRVYSHEVNQFGIRVGRLKNPFGFYNDTRDVPFTRPSILLPQSIYFDRTRNLGLSADSVQLYGESDVLNLGTVSTQFGVTWPLVNDRDTEMAILQSEPPGHLQREASYIGRGIFETYDKRLRLAVSGIWLNTDYNPARNDQYGPGAFQFTPIFFSAQYNTERWSLTSEYALRHFKYNNQFHNPLDGINAYGESFYFQGEYRFTPKWEAILRYDFLFADRTDRDGSRYAAETGKSADGQFAKDFTAGLRWNVTSAFMLRAEYHRINGTGWLSKLDNPNPSNTHQHWNLFAIQASYRF